MINCALSHKRFLEVACLVLFIAVTNVSAQSQAFTYQGRLTDGPTPANGSYQMEFKLFNALAAGAQQGATITNNSVSVVNGTFTVQLDFSPATPFASGADRWVEISVRKPADPPGFTTLTPRQQITSSPYSIRTLSATAADSLSSGCVTCVIDAQINSLSGTKITGTVSNATNANNATIAGNITGTVAVANGGTGATSAANARTNLGLGTLATVTPSGSGNATTFLRGDNSWTAVAGGSTPVFSVRTTNLIVSGSAFVDVVSVNLEANRTYFIETFIIGQRVGGTSGASTFQIVYSGSATTEFGLLLGGNVINDTIIDPTPSFDSEAAGLSSLFTAAPTPKFALTGYFRTTTAGTLTIRGGRASTNTTVDLNIREGTYLLARPVN